MSPPPPSPPSGGGEAPASSLRGWPALWQPQRPAFWLWIAFNLLSSGFAWAMRSLALNDTALVLFGALAMLNAVFGLLVAWRLWQGH